MDFALWERDEISAARLSEWLEVLAEAPPERIGKWIAGLDVELVALLLLKTSRIYDSVRRRPARGVGRHLLSHARSLFVLDGSACRRRRRGRRERSGPATGGARRGTPSRSARAVIRISIRSTAAIACSRAGCWWARAPSCRRRCKRWRTAGATGAWPTSGSPTTGKRSRSTASSIRRACASARRPARRRACGRCTARGGTGDSLRAPTALAERLSGNTSPFSRAVAGLTAPDEVAELHFALVALGNRVLAADRVTPGDDEAVNAALGRCWRRWISPSSSWPTATTTRAVEAVRTVPVVRLFRLGVSLVGKVKQLARVARAQGTRSAALGAGLFEDSDAAVIEAVTRLRPAFSRAARRSAQGQRTAVRVDGRRGARHGRARRRRRRRKRCCTAWGCAPSTSDTDAVATTPAGHAERRRRGRD